jgi:hypothetical protein
LVFRSHSRTGYQGAGIDVQPLFASLLLKLFEMRGRKLIGLSLMTRQLTRPSNGRAVAQT